VGEGKEEATYAEPVLDGKNSSNLSQPGLQADHHHQDAAMFHFAQPYARDLYRYLEYFLSLYVLVFSQWRISVGNSTFCNRD